MTQPQPAATQMPKLKMDLEGLVNFVVSSVPIGVVSYSFWKELFAKDHYLKFINNFHGLKMSSCLPEISNRLSAYSEALPIFERWFKQAHPETIQECISGVNYSHSLMNLYYNSVGLPNVPEVIRSPSLDYSLVPMYSIQTAENFRQAAINALTIPNSEYISMFLLAASTGVIISLGVVGAHYVWTQNEDRIFDYASEKLAAAKNGVAALKTNMIRQWKNM